MFRFRPALILIFSSSAIFLSACSSSPSETDVRAAASKQIDDQQKAQTALLGKNAILDQQIAEQRKALEGMKLIGCKSSSEKAYDCDVEVLGQSVQMRMVKGSNGWLISG